MQVVEGQDVSPGRRSFGQLLREHRVEANMTQGRLAELAGVSTRAAQCLEGRFGQPFPETVRRQRSVPPVPE